jgi:putative ABC transport system permease protein
MFRSYLKTAFRNLWKHRRFSAINIAGLVIGMAACLLIMQYVSFELSYDQANKNAKDIYRVANDRYQNGKLIQHGTITYSAVGKAMNDDFEEVINNTRVEPGGEQIIQFEDKRLAEDSVFFVENSFFAMFSYPLLVGNRNEVLQAPYTVLLSETLAKKIFNERDLSRIVGKAVKLGTDSKPYKIEGVFKDVPENSHLQFHLLISYKTLAANGWKQSEYDFTDSDFWHYVQLKSGTDYEALNKRMDAFSKKHFDGNKVSGSDEKFYLQPLSKAHLYSDFEYEIGMVGKASVVWGLLVIALFIIGIAWINYINLATARSVERAKEVGIRKVVGGMRRQLITQFLIESAIVNIIAIILSLALVFLLQPSFNNLLERGLSLSYLFTKGLSGYTISISLLLIIVIGILLSGFYPAFVLSSFKPITVLKGKLTNSKRGIILRKALVIGQFTITVALIIGSWVVLSQLRYMNKTDLGFHPDQIMVIKAPSFTNWDSTFIDKVNSFKEEMKQLTFVKGATTSWSVPGGELGRSFDVRRADSATRDRFTVRHTGIDYDFVPTMEIKVIAGRNYTPSDHNPDWSKLHNIIINRSAAKLLGFASPQAAIGKSIERGDGQNYRKWDVVGVVEDYHQKSLRYALEPIIFFPAYSTNSEISIKLTTKDIAGKVDAIKNKYSTFFPGNFFDFYFLDDYFNRQYKDDRLFSKVFAIFAGFAIFVACLGLFGLAMFSTVQRTKEIGVRKVLGASVPNILVLISKDFIKLVLIASIIAFPLAWWSMTKWLEDFSFRIGIAWWVFAAAAVLALAIALITVSAQALKAAMSSPVKSLRTE